MKKTFVKLEPIYLVGISVRTNNANEMNPKAAKIGPTMQRFFESKLQEKILNRKNPGKIFAVYTNYESDFTGDYTYFIGEEVTIFKDLSGELQPLTIPVQNYMKFTSNPGVMPNVVIDLWKQIWQIPFKSPEVGKRAYIADFEVYDERSHDLQNAIVDIYIGIENND